MPLYEQEIKSKPLDIPVMRREEPESMEQKPVEETGTIEAEPEPVPEPMVFEKETIPEESYPNRTIIFNMEPQESESRKIIHEDLTEEKKYEQKEVEIPVSEVFFKPSVKPVQKPEPEVQKEQPEMERMMNDRVQKLRALSEKLKTHPPLETHLAEIESVPAYKRRNIELTDVTPSSESQVPLYTVSEKDTNIEINKANTYLHNNVD
jgi:cell division protein FtsZ